MDTQEHTKEDTQMQESLAMSSADIKAGRVHDLDEVFAELRQMISKFRKKAE